MGRVLALDIGEKTIGIAWSDETQLLALPGETLIRQPGKRKDMALLSTMVREKGVSEIVVGLPLMMDGTRGIQVEKVEDFVATLRNFVRIPIILQDERLSTTEAQRAATLEGQSRQSRKKVIDSMAASLFLQTYLDQKRNRARWEEEQKSE